MNTSTVKKASEIKLTNIKVELHTKNGTVEGVTLIDATTGAMVIARNTGWSFELLVQAEPKMVKRYQVAGKLRGIAFCETFEHEHEALARVNDIGVEADPIEVKEIAVPEPE